MNNQKILIILIIQIITIFFPIYTYSNWEYLKGPDKETAISALEVDGNTIYIGQFDKLFKTENIGKTWIEIKYNDSNYFFGINNIVKLGVDIFVQSPYRTSEPFYELIHSNNEGMSWRKANADYTPSYYNCLCKNNEQVFTSFYSNSTSRKYLKYNSELGEWDDIIDSLTNGKIYFEPKTIYSYNNKIYFGLDKSQNTIDNLIKNKPSIYIYNPSEKTLIPIIDSTTDFWKSRVNCFIDKDSVLFIGTSTGVFKSTDEGLTWIKKSDGIHYKDDYSDFDYSVNRMMVFQNYIYAVAYIPKTYDYYTPQNTVLYYSVDDGESWHYAQNFVREWVQDFRVMNEKIILSTYNGLFQTDKTLESKISLLNDTLNSGTVLDICFQDNKLYAAKYKNFIWVTIDNGNNWESIADQSLNQLIISKMYIKDNMLYLTNNYTYFLISNDYGKTYKYINDGNGLKNTQVYTIYEDENNIVYVGTRYGIYFSSDKGESWEKLATPLILDVPIMSMEKVEDNLFVGTYKNGIYRYNLTDKILKHLEIPQKNEEITVNEIKYIKNKLYFGTYVSPNSFKGITVEGEGIFVSSDLGETWEKRNNGFPDSCETKTIVEYGDCIFAGVSLYGGVYYTIDEGLNWFPLNKGYAGIMLNKLKINGDYLYAATSSGIYRLNIKDWITGVDEIEVKNNFYTQYVFPNPAHDRVTAKIYWDLRLDIGTAKIGIYNIYGNKIESDENIEIIQESDWSGKLTWNCSGVPVGTYFIKIDYGTETKVIKFVKI
ncbi:MAG: hypothetical protein A2X64_07035 [Ignavibacteria bacterium GWF2_33_9]|nr:MAG: hypothetical protein A2X64_07035 [Ignavibacteria bacterium GWF2_33_9]